MKVRGDWITHPGSQALCAVLEGAGFRALFVGGCVRNDLLGVPVADIDLATDATPEIVSDGRRACAPCPPGSSMAPSPSSPKAGRTK